MLKDGIKTEGRPGLGEAVVTGSASRSRAGEHQDGFAVQGSPLKRFGTPKDIADVVALVVSEETRWLTGQNVHAGGGVVM